MSQISGLERVAFWTVMSGLVLHQSSDLITNIGLKLLRTFFYQVEIPPENNPILVSKIQAFLKKKAIGGSETIIENGNDKIKTGCMLTFFPFSVVYVNRQTKISIFLNRWGQKTNSFLHRLDDSDSINFYTMDSRSNDWQKAKTLDRLFSYPLYNDRLISTLQTSVSEFLESGDYYRSLGKTHKFTILLYGPNGTGKTVCAKWLAMKYGRDVYVVDPSHYFCDMMDLQKTINSNFLGPCQGGILLFEDVDRYFATLYAKQQKPNISNFLNLLDGLCTPENILIILTANCTGDIPECILRDGRIDLSISFPYVDDEIKNKVCDLYRVNPEYINLEGDVTTSELIKKIESSKDILDKGLAIELKKPPLSDSISIVSL